MNFLKIDEKLFISKNDPEDPRFGDLVKLIAEDSPLENAFVILGYPDDEGIKKNGGRPGAALAPGAIRKHLYKTTPGLNSKNLHVYDYGDLEISGTLKARHQSANEMVFKLLQRKANVITFGGGHDFGFSDFDAFVQYAAKAGKKPFIVNFDAHLDVRPNAREDHSGTPFFRLLEKYSPEKMDFYEVGIQDWCNSRSHLAWAQDRGAKIITLNEILHSRKPLVEYLNDNVWSKVEAKHEVAISIDIDCFESSSCPGASQVFPVGINTNNFMASWRLVINNFKPKLASIYEVSPPFDLDDRTAKMAALIAHQFIFARE
jgi:formiminoglutamase